MNWIRSLFVGNKKNTESVVSKIREMALLSNDIIMKRKKLDTLEYDIMLENKEEMYISLASFLFLMNKVDSLSITDIIKECKHVTEIKTENTSFIEAYPLLKNDQLILSANPDPEFQVEKIKITTWRMKK